MNIRGLSTSEANTDGLISNRGFTLEATPQDIVPSPRGKRMAERQQKATFKSDNPSDESENENSINNEDKTGYNPYREAVRQKIVSTIRNKQFHCQQCDKNFSLQGALYNHNKSSREGVKYPCTECNYKATEKGSLQRHVGAAHEGVRYPCTECNNEASTKGSL